MITKPIRFLVTAALMVAMFLTLQSVSFADSPDAPRLQTTATPEATGTVDSTVTPMATVTVDTTITPTATVTVAATGTADVTSTVVATATIESTGTAVATMGAGTSTPVATGTPIVPQTLPQTGAASTGDDDSSIFGMIGLVALGILGLAFMVRRTN